jgi:type I restriction enzyme R subunit
VIDYDYIMGLMSRFSQQGLQGGGKQKMTKDELLGLILSDAKFMNERDDIAAYIHTLKAGEGLSEAAIREGYTRSRRKRQRRAGRHCHPPPTGPRCAASLCGRHLAAHDF